MKQVDIECTQLIELARKKYEIDQKRAEAKFLDLEWMLHEIVGEVEEVRAEIKADNSAFLEDELGDILWGLVVLAVRLEKKSYITSAEEIVKRALQKYTERIEPLQGDTTDHATWDSVKQRQKIALQKENDHRYKRE